MFANWKTTVAGVGAALTAAGHLLSALAHGDTSSLMTDLPLIIAGIGLVFAPDASKVVSK